MSDIEDELLALAGGDVSDDEQGASDRSRGESESHSLPSPSRESNVKGTASNRAALNKAKKRTQPGDSEEEGEASSAPSSPGSQQSAPMDESDSDSDSPQNRTHGDDDDDDANKYPVDGLFISHGEKAEIMRMREVEREIKIAERREEIERIRQNRLLRHMVVNQDTKKRKAGAAELEDGQRKTARVRTKVGGTRVGETSSGIDSLRKAREERSNRMQQREQERDRRRPRSPSYRRSTSRDGRGDSDIEWGSPGRKKKSRTPEVVEELVPELRDLERVRVGRSRFAEVCFYPGFEETITGCFVRINIGLDPRTNQDVYRMAVIKGFTKGKPYAMPNRKGHQFVVETYVKAAHGKAQREWPFISCSDGAFVESEWNRYKSVCGSEDVPVPHRRALVDKIDEINRLVNRSWTELELAEKLNRQNTLRAKYSGNERDRLQKALDDAKAAGNDAKAVQLQDELDQLETPRLAFKTSLTPTKKKPEKEGLSQQERLAALNRENRRRNADSVRQAQLKERARAREIEAKIERGEAVAEDHSRRLKTKARFLHDVNEHADAAARSASAKASGASTPATLGSGTPVLGAQKQLPLLPHLAKLQLQQQQSLDKNGIPTIHKPLMDDDIIGALDLDIDVDID